MTPIPNLPTALRQQADADPEAPFLFWPEGWHWRWWSWRQAAELAARWSAALAGLPAGAGTGFAGDAWPQSIVLDLAIQEAGLTPVPMNLAAGGGADGERADGPGVDGRGAEGRGAEGRGADDEGADGGTTRAVEEPGAAAGARAVAAPIDLLVTLEGERPAALAPRITWLPSRRLSIRHGPPAGAKPVSAPAAEAAGTGPAVVVTDVTGRWHGLSQPELMAAVARLETVMGAPPVHRRRSQRREVLVAGWPLQQWPARLLTTWAITAGAALVLEAEPARRQGTVLWARPTVFYGGGADLAALRRHVEATARQPRRLHRARPLALPAGRLRTLFQPDPPAPADATFWQQRGARLLQLPGVVC